MQLLEKLQEPLLTAAAAAHQEEEYAAHLNIISSYSSLGADPAWTQRLALPVWMDELAAARYMMAPAACLLDVTPAAHQVDVDVACPYRTSFTAILCLLCYPLALT